MHVLDFIKLGRSDNPTSCIHPYLLSCLLWASGTADNRALNVFFLNNFVEIFSQQTHIYIIALQFQQHCAAVAF